VLNPFSFSPYLICGFKKEELQRRRLMKVKSVLLVFGLAVTGLLARSASAQEARVTVESTKSYEQTVEKLKGAVNQGGMMIMGQVDQGNMLSMAGLKLKATLFLVGNPTVGKKLFEQDHGVGLFVPLRVFVYEDKDGKTYLSYDKPSALLKQFNNQEIDMVAGMLDQKLQGLAQMATH
jgi:uncharacterized protein (DUF302 family)